MSVKTYFVRSRDSTVSRLGGTWRLMFQECRLYEEASSALKDATHQIQSIFPSVSFDTVGRRDMRSLSSVTKNKQSRRRRQLPQSSHHETRNPVKTLLEPIKQVSIRKRTIIFSQSIIQAHLNQVQLLFTRKISAKLGGEIPETLEGMVKKLSSKSSYETRINKLD